MSKIGSRSKFAPHSAVRRIIPTMQEPTAESQVVAWLTKTSEFTITYI